MKRNNIVGWLFIVLLISAAGCENIALVGRPTPEIDGDAITGEVIGIDRRSNEIHLRPTEIELRPAERGRAATRTIRYDETTQVIYRGQDYPISALEVGDIVTLQVWSRDRSSFTKLIRVQQNVRERDLARSGARQRIEGTVEAIDRRAGSFEMREQSGQNIVVSVAPNTPRAVLDEIDQLRRGDRVVAEGRFLSRSRFELENLL